MINKIVLASLIGLIASFTALAETPSSESTGFLVIVNAQVQESMTTEQLAHLFLGRNISSKTGIKLKPVVMSGNLELHEKFSRKILKRSPSQLKSYWSKLVFTGKGRPPISVSSIEEMMSQVRKDASFVGYIPITEDLVGLNVVYRSKN